MNDFLSLAKSRFTCRQFAAAAPADEDLIKILQAANAAPTACNLQPFTLLAVRGQSLERIQNCAWLYGAPLAIVVCTNEKEAWQRKYDGQNFAIVDAAIAATHMMLEAEDLGLGCCFVGAIKTHLLTEALDIKPPLRAQFLLAIGYKEEGFKPDKLHFERKPLDRQVIYLN